MEIFVNELVRKGSINIDDKVDITEKCDKLIKRIDLVNVKGIIKYNVLEEIELNLDVNGTMYIDDSVTLEEVPYEFKLKIDEVLNEFDEYYANFFKNNKNILDISEILWENIVLEVPISYTKSKELNLSGNGWELNNKLD